MKTWVIALVAAAVVLAGSAVLVLAPLAIRTLAFEPFTIPSVAMEPTLHQGDYVIVSKSAYGYSRHSILGGPPVMQGRVAFHPPKRGDVIVFVLPRDGRTSYIKRLIGLPGDKVQLRRGVVFINGTPLAQQFQKTISTNDRERSETASVMRETTPGGRSYLILVHSGGEPEDNTGVYVVPAHCYFFLGDNRENSADSRFDPGPPAGEAKLGGCAWDSQVDTQVGDEFGVGFVPEANLVGKAISATRQNPSGGLESVAIQ
jgi:signal peptidase I